jgi:hypothetical protein
MDLFSFRAKDQLGEQIGRVFKYQDYLTDGSITVLAPLLTPIIRYALRTSSRCPSPSPFLEHLQLGSG